MDNEEIKRLLKDDKIQMIRAYLVLEIAKKLGYTSKEGLDKARELAQSLITEDDDMYDDMFGENLRI